MEIYPNGGRSVSWAIIAVYPSVFVLLTHTKPPRPSSTFTMFSLQLTHTQPAFLVDLQFEHANRNPHHPLDLFSTFRMKRHSAV